MQQVRQGGMVRSLDEKGESRTAGASGQASRLIVEDGVDGLQPGQMRRGDYLDRLEHVVLERAEEALKGTVWTAQGCPWIAYWFGYYRSQDAVHLESAIHRYIPDAAAADTAERYVELVAARIERGLARFARTGSLGDIPHGAPRSLPAGVSWSDIIDSAGGRRSSYLARLERMRTETPAAAAALETLGAEAVARENRVEQIREQLGEGEPLAADVRSRMSDALGEDVGDARIHADSRSAALAAREDARAFTVGRDVVFGAGEYRPGTLTGEGLIAHELAHVLQQRDAGEEEPAATESVERDAERSTRGALVRSLARGLRGFRGLMEGMRENAKPALKSGLQLARCTDVMKDPDVVRRRDSLNALGELNQFNSAGLPILPLPPMDKEGMRKLGYDPEKFTFTYIDGGSNEVFSFIGSRYRVEYNGKFIGFIHVQYQHYPHSYYKDNLYRPLPGDVQIQIARTNGNDPATRADLENLHLTGFGKYMQGATLYDLGAAEAESRLEEMHQGGGMPEPAEAGEPPLSGGSGRGHGMNMTEEEPPAANTSSHATGGKLSTAGEGEELPQVPSGKPKVAHEEHETVPRSNRGTAHSIMEGSEGPSKPNAHGQRTLESEQEGAHPSHPAGTRNATEHGEHVEEGTGHRQGTPSSSSHERPAAEDRTHETTPTTTAHEGEEKQKAPAATSHEEHASEEQTHETNPPTAAHGPGDAEPNTVHAERPKPRYTENPQHHPNHPKVKRGQKDPLPDDAGDVYQTAIENPEYKVQRAHGDEYWGINNDGVYYRYQGSNGEVHWNGSSKSQSGQPRNPPKSIQKELDAQLKMRTQK